MKKSILIPILILFYLNTSSQNHKCDTTIEKTKIVLHKMPNKVYNIVYENKRFKLYFIKNQVITFAKSRTYGFEGLEKTDIDPLIKVLNSKITLIQFSDPNWELNKNPKKYGYVETDNNDEKKSSIYIVEHNKFLRNSALFENILVSFLLKGQFSIFDKKNKSFIKTKHVYYINKTINYPSGYERIEKFQLKNGLIIFKNYSALSISD